MFTDSHPHATQSIKRRTRNTPIHQQKPASSDRPLVVLTGACGRVGVTVHRSLLEGGIQVRATDRICPKDAMAPVVKANLYHAAHRRRVFEGANTLVHLAYRREPDGYPNGYPARTFDDHIRLNRLVFLSAVEAGVKRIIFSSTIQVVAKQAPILTANGLPPSLPLSERSPREPDNWYSLAKLCSEEMLAMLRRQHGIDYTILRFPSLLNTVPIPHPEWHKGRRSEALSYLTIRDAGEVILKVIEAGVPGGRVYMPASYNNTQSMAVGDLLRDVYAGVPVEGAAGDLSHLVDNETITRDIGWVPKDLSQPDVQPRVPFYWRVRKRLTPRLPNRVKRILRGIRALRG